MPSEPDARDALRRQLRERRKALPAAQQAAAARAVAGHIRTLPGWDTARHIGLYWPNDGELATQPLAQACRAQGKQTYLPVLAQERRLVFREWLDDQAMQPNRFGIPEPDSSGRSCTAGELDLLIMPLVGWQRDGYRLGMGGGFYDRTLADARGVLRVGLAYVCQEINGLDSASWDIPMQWVLTESGLTACFAQGRMPTR
jgi:5-formyltetrahydrofolate cyclo-ligase